jgi:hypothetical protein
VADDPRAEAVLVPVRALLPEDALDLLVAERVAAQPARDGRIGEEPDVVVEIVLGGPAEVENVSTLWHAGDVTQRHLDTQLRLTDALEGVSACVRVAVIGSIA